MAVFSEYELKEMGIKFASSEVYQTVECIGSCEEELESRTVIKKCRGNVVKTKTKGTGKGTLKISAHIPYEIYTQAYGMELDTLKDGIKAYGQESVHEEFSVTQLVKGISKLCDSVWNRAENRKRSRRSRRVGA